MYDYLIVGSGISGSVFAQQAKEAGKSVAIDMHQVVASALKTTKDELSR